MKRFLLAAAVTLTMISAGASLHAQTILAVDFNQTGSANSVNQSGFSAFNLPASNAISANASQTFSTGSGNITVTFVGGAVSSRVRNVIANNPPTFTYGALMNDIINQFSITTANSTTTPATVNPTVNSFTLSGLAANQAYTIRLWSLDTGFNNGLSVAWYNTTAGTGASSVLIGSITNSTSPTFASDNAYSTFGTVTSDANGILRFGQVTASASVSGYLNGFELAAVPEPRVTAALLAGVAVVAILVRRRRVEAGTR